MTGLASHMFKGEKCSLFLFSRRRSYSQRFSSANRHPIHGVWLVKHMARGKGDPLLCEKEVGWLDKYRYSKSSFTSPPCSIPFVFVAHFTLPMHLETTSTMDDLSREVRTHGRSQEHVCHGYLNRHTRSLQRSLRYTEFLHCLGWVAFGRWLKWCPAVPTISTNYACTDSQGRQELT